jgi:hypothetical protein
MMPPVPYAAPTLAAQVQDAALHDPVLQHCLTRIAQGMPPADAYMHALLTLSHLHRMREDTFVAVLAQCTCGAAVRVVRDRI